MFSHVRMHLMGISVSSLRLFADFKTAQRCKSEYVYECMHHPMMDWRPVCVTSLQNDPDAMKGPRPFVWSLHVLVSALLFHGDASFSPQSDACLVVDSNTAFVSLIYACNELATCP